MYIATSKGDFRFVGRFVTGFSAGQIPVGGPAGRKFATVLSDVKRDLDQGEIGRGNLRALVFWGAELDTSKL